MEETAARREDEQLRVSQSKSAETVEETTARRAASQLQVSHSRTTETVEETAARREADRLRTSRARAKEPAEAAARRLEDQRQTAAAREGERLALVDNVGDFTHNCSDFRPRSWFRLGFFNDGTLPHAAHNSISVGTMSVVCQFCRTKRRYRERSGLCCVNGKVVLPAFEHPPARLQSLLSGVNLDELKHFLNNIRSTRSVGTKQAGMFLAVKQCGAFWTFPFTSGIHWCSICLCTWKMGIVCTSLRKMQKR